MVCKLSSPAQNLLCLHKQTPQFLKSSQNFDPSGWPCPQKFCIGLSELLKLKPDM